MPTFRKPPEEVTLESTPVTPRPGPPQETAEDSDDSNDSDSEYLSFDNSDEEDQETEEQRRIEREARASERQRVLEAAGLIVRKDDRRPPPRVPHKHHRHRPPPLVPGRLAIITEPEDGKDKELPSVPTPQDDAENIMYVDDAYERYEAFKQSQHNRLSVASSFEITPSPTITSPALSVAVSMSKADSSEGRFSDKLRDFLGRSKTPEERRTLTISGPISGPILTREPSPVASENSTVFGAVSHDQDPTICRFSHLSKSWASLVDKSALEGIPSHERKRQEVCRGVSSGINNMTNFSRLSSS